MADRKSENRGTKGDAEVFELLEKADKQYEEYVRLSKLGKFPDFREGSEEEEIKYSWKKPIGLVITKSRKNYPTIGSFADLYV